MNELLKYTITNPILIILVSFILGGFISFICSRSMKSTRNITVSLIFLPALTAATLLAVNGNLGTSVAILGIFGLTRFRSFPGTALDIISIFYAMVSGLLISTGQIIETFIIVAIIGAVIFIASKLIKSANNEYEINVYMLESQSLDCTYEETIKKYCKKYRLENLLTTETNKLYSITYKIALKEDVSPLTIIEDLNNKNQNLSISFKHIEKEDSIL